MKKLIYSAGVIVFIVLGIYVFKQNYRLAPRTVDADIKPFSIKTFLSEPVCYFEAIKTDVPTKNGYLEDVAFIELTYVDTDKIKGVYYYLPAEKDRKAGTISSYSVETVYPDRESYLIKAFYEYDAEGDHHKEQQFFMLINDEIRIASGEMKLDDDGKTYIYAGPESIRWTDAYPRSDCKTARSHGSWMDDL